MKSHGSKAGCWTAAIQVTLILVTESYFLFKLQEKINHRGSCYKVTFHCPKSPLPIEEATLSLPSPAFLSVTSSSVTVNSGHQHTKNWLKLVEGEFPTAGLQCMFKHRLILASQNNSILDCMLYFFNAFKQEIWGCILKSLQKTLPIYPYKKEGLPRSDIKESNISGLFGDTVTGTYFWTMKRPYICVASFIMAYHQLI